VDLCGARNVLTFSAIFSGLAMDELKGKSLYSPFPIVYFPIQKKRKVIIIWMPKTFLYYSLHKILFEVYSIFFLVALMYVC